MRVNSSILRSKRRIPLLFGLIASLFLALLFWSTPANAVTPTTHVSDGATSVSAPMAVASPLLFIGADTNVNTTASDEEIVCIGGALGYIVCPLIDISITMIKTIAAFLDVIFNFQALNNTELRSAWGIFVNLANIFLAIGFLAIVISQTTSIGISNYGIKRMLPRVVAAAIMINMSFYVAALAVDISNVLGKNMLSFMTSFSSNVEPAGDPGAALGNSGASTACRVVGQAGGGVAGGVAGNLAGGVAGIPGRIAGTFWGLKQGASFGEKVGCTVAAVGLALTGGLTFITIIIAVGLIAVFIAFITTLALAFMRYVILIFLVVLAPLAFAAWVLPNTDKYFYKWWTLFIKLLMIYPIAMFLFGGSIFAADVIGNITEINNGEFVRELFPGSGAITEEAVRGVWAVIQLFIIATPLFIIPKLFKGLDSVTGGISGKMAAAGTLGGAIRGARKGVKTYNKGRKMYNNTAYGQYRQAQYQEHLAHARAGKKTSSRRANLQGAFSRAMGSNDSEYIRRQALTSDSLSEKRIGEEQAIHNRDFARQQDVPGVGDSATMKEMAINAADATGKRKYTTAQQRAGIDQLYNRGEFEKIGEVKQAAQNDPVLKSEYALGYDRNGSKAGAAPSLNPAHIPNAAPGEFNAFAKMSAGKLGSIHSYDVANASHESFGLDPTGKNKITYRDPADGKMKEMAPKYEQQIVFAREADSALSNPTIDIDTSKRRIIAEHKAKLEKQAEEFSAQKQAGYNGIDAEEATRRDNFLKMYQEYKGGDSKQNTTNVPPHRDFNDSDG